jgi:hypothetical protein
MTSSDKRILLAMEKLLHARDFLVAAYMFSDFANKAAATGEMNCVKALDVAARHLGYTLIPIPQQEEPPPANTGGDHDVDDPSSFGPKARSPSDSGRASPDSIGGA